MTDKTTEILGALKARSVESRHKNNVYDEWATHIKSLRTQITEVRAEVEREKKWNHLLVDNHRKAVAELEARTTTAEAERDELAARLVSLRNAKPSVEKFLPDRARQIMALTDASLRLYRADDVGDPDERMAAQSAWDEAVRAHTALRKEPEG